MSRLALLSLVALLSACNIIVPAAYLVEGPPANEAQYTLPDRKTVVFVDDRRSLLPRTQLRTIIGDRVAQDLMRKELVTDTIASRDALAVARRDETAGKPMPIDEIGRKVGADVIIYVEVGRFSPAEPGGVPRPNGFVMVKVIDVVGRRRLFPAESEQSAVRVDSGMREVSMDLYNSRAGEAKIEEQLADDLGDRVAKLFYKHEKNELGKGIGVRR